MVVVGEEERKKGGRIEGGLPEIFILLHSMQLIVHYPTTFCPECYLPTYLLLILLYV